VAWKAINKAAYINGEQRAMFQRIAAGVDPFGLPQLGEIDESKIETGDMWLDPDDDRWRIQLGMNLLTVGAQGALMTVNTNYILSTTGETRFAGSTNCFFLLKSETIHARRVIGIEASGDYSDTGTPTLTLKLKANNVTLFNLGAQTLGSGVSDKQWRVRFTCRIGVTTDTSAPVVTSLDDAMTPSSTRPCWLALSRMRPSTHRWTRRSKCRFSGARHRRPIRSGCGDSGG
jgi:hypothetical protein